MNVAYVSVRRENLVQVGISEMAISGNAEETLITYSLGSCVGVTFYDPVAKIGAMIHCMLPLSTSDPDKAKANPYMFVDTGITKLLQALFDLGAQRKRLICKVAGGGAPLDDKGVFKIGERNYLVLRKVLWKNEIVIKGEDVGGNSPRTMLLEMSTGKTLLKTSGGAEKEL